MEKDGEKEVSENQPNIVMISCDHLRGDMLGCAGHPTIQTPTIDHLAKRGMRFEQAYSTAPICIPARGTIMTGLQGHRLGLKEYKPGFELPVKETLPQQLSDAGYQTMAVGKMHFYPERCHYGFQQMHLWEEGRRFGEPYGENRGYGDYEEWLAEQGYPGQAYGHGLNLHDYSVTPWHLPNHLHPTEWIGQKACKEIKRRDWTRPLFLWASFTAPHPPMAPLMEDLYMYDRDEMPKPFIGDWADKHSSFYDRNKVMFNGEEKTNKQIDMAYRAYFALVTHVDRQINRMIGTILEEGMLENTWFIFISDHGDNMGDHRLWGKGNFLKGSCNIPMIITPPTPKNVNDHMLGSDWVPGRVNRSVVGLQDLLPTIVNIGKGEIPDGIDGKSLLPLVKESTKSVRETILGEFGKDGNRSFMLTDGSWKYIWHETDGMELLFHIETDRNELHDLSTVKLDMKEKWKGKLLDILASRENDPAIRNLKDEYLSPKTVTNGEKAKMVYNIPPYLTPGGLH